MPHSNLTQIARTLRKNDTWAERSMWKWLRDRRFSAYKFRRQHTFGPHILDFFCVEAMLDIELDGSRHGTPDQLRKDDERDAWLEARGVTVIRFWNAQLRREKEVVREAIWRALQERAPRPLPDYCSPLKGPDGSQPMKAVERRVPPHPDPLPRGEGTVGGPV